MAILQFESWERPFLSEANRKRVRQFAEGLITTNDGQLPFELDEVDTWIQFEDVADLHFITNNDSESENFGQLEVYAYGLNIRGVETEGTDLSREEFVGVLVGEQLLRGGRSEIVIIAEERNDLFEVGDDLNWEDV